MSTVWAVKGAHLFRCKAHILRFLKDERCSVRIVEVRLFKTSRLSERVPMDMRCWKPGGDLTETDASSSMTATLIGGDTAASAAESVLAFRVSFHR